MQELKFPAERNTAMELLYQAENLEIRYNYLVNVLYPSWRGAQTKDGIFHGGEAIYRIFKDLHCNKILNDNSLKKGLWNHSVEWAAREWFPKMEQAGLEYFAWVFPKGILVKISGKRAMLNSKIVKPFESYETAEDWILSMPGVSGSN